VFGTLINPRKSILLLVVLGVFLMIVGITALSQAILVSTTYSQSILESVVGSDAATIKALINDTLTPADIAAGASTTDVSARLERPLKALVEPRGIARIEIRRPDGTVIASDDPTVVGATAPLTPDFAKAVSGTPTADLAETATAEVLGPALGPGELLREYFPIKSDGRVRAIVGLWRDGQPIIDRLGSVRQDVIIVTLTAGVAAGFILFLVFRAAQGRINRQTEQLVEATRRDPLTDTPNHGTLVMILAAAIESARTTGEPITIALLDIDNFRLLNDTHGHQAGDRAILTIAELLRDGSPVVSTFGRYGPDEFLVIEPGADPEVLEQVFIRIRAGLAEKAVQFGESESLPVTISAGICAYPEHAGSVTDLLSAATITLQEAKTSGGDAVRVAGPDLDIPVETRTFDVYQGLILAVDGRDRYTKRHSEDVSRYAVYLAERLELEAEVVSTIRVAGLLHDVGKIGVPDAMLRKPARLTEEEFTVMKQHVMLGDLIVRDLPHCDLIRAGIRHHHERWDGSGYPDGLEGDDIPLVARIIAVADAFSAMTTTRPYRKALPTDEALRRIEEAAGTQLEERLVTAFVGGLRYDENAPLPGTDPATGRPWTPYIRVA
jgi:diguanylate cyclase (GGDEF)-like protein